ncbi:hypothetical protein VOLCADRAFT_104805 [Volvox carteri f. nagariensis]|uniref:Cilia- and flagella-associated protein 43 n=1 Tax=Volvox carteri f. nagariensis TaxID=3068 RepID=D8TW77_VOLCA|nr:uncharacterized protein VOLCADRAFT_104805 [Volvox carteri f. nagariensis]EFJ48324.1 hypothetical protein VOLCADRAFT_104805 [Volvox carteri f. nagariensis]|eukprot:XP_002950578.1 hypothetical protein VOLCADRAFT_104805 [Volvox carteri f. nagariensis]
MDVVAITSAGYGGRVCFLDETNLCYASGHGVIIHDKETGMQKHIWVVPDGQGHPPANMCPATFATCPGGHLLAYVQQGAQQQQQIQVVQQDSLLPASTIKDPSTRHMEFLQLVFDADGTRLASLGGGPDNQLDVWDVDMKESLLRVPLPDSLTGFEPAFFPLNSAVLALGGPDAVRLLWDEPLAGARVVRQSDVDLSVMVEGEQLNCMVLGVRGAAPPAIPTSSWGESPGGGHAAEVLYGTAAPPAPGSANGASKAPPPSVSFLQGPAPPRSGVVAIVLTATHVLLVMGGGVTASAELVWLLPHSMNPVAVAPLPLRALVRAAVSPSYEQLAIASADGSIATCSTICPIPGLSLGRLTADGEGGSSASLPPPAAAAGAGGGSVPSGSGDTPLLMVAEQGGPAAAAAAAGGGAEHGPGRRSTSATVGSGSAASCAPVERGALVQVTDVARFHRGRISSCLWLTPTRLVTGGMDGTVRMWSYVPNDGDPPDRAGWLSPGLQLDAQWNVSQPVTCMAALNPPLPAGAEWPGTAAAAGGGGGGAEGGGGGADFAASWAASAPKPPAFMLGTAGGVVQLVNADRVPADIAEAPDLAQLNASLSSTWDVRVFGGPITAAAFSQVGRKGKGIHPLLVVGSILGELVVLGLPDSSALEDGPPDGVLPRGSLLRASMRAQSHVTSMLVYPLPASEARGGGHFWVITTHTDKSIRRYRMYTDEVERLTPEEFVVDLGLRKALLEHAEERYGKVKTQLAREMRVMEFQRQRLKEECMGVMECASRPLVPLGEYAFISPMDPAEVRKYRFEGESSAARTEGGVWSYGLCKMKRAQELRLKQVAFLRKVEQAEGALRGSQERGAVVPIRRYKGDMQRKFSLVMGEEEQQQLQQQGQGLAQPLSSLQSAQPSSQLSGQYSLVAGGPGGQGGQGQGQPYRVQQTYDDGEEDDEGQSLGGTSKSRRQFRDDGFEGTEPGYGETGLLYADVQLYTHCRRVSQMVFIQEEVRSLRRLFNARWDASRAAKQKALDRIDERLGRIVEIQKELTKLAVEEGAGEAPPPAPKHIPGEFYGWSPEEEMVALAPVRDEEVACECARGWGGERGKRAEGGYVCMWKELAEELDKHRRLLEAERRALEVDIAELAAGVNTDLTRLSNSKVRMDMEIVHLERRATDLATLVASLSAARAARAALTTQLAANTTRRTRRSPLLAALEAKVQAAQQAYEDIALSEKQVDKAFRREFSSRPELWDDAQKVYRTRSHLLHGSASTGSLGATVPGAAATAGPSPTPGFVTTARLPSKTALELLGKSPEGQALAAALETPGPGEVSQSQSTTSVPVLRHVYGDRAVHAYAWAHGKTPSLTSGAAPPPPLAPAKPRHGIGAVLIMAGEEAALARRGISQRPAGLRLRALVEKEGHPLDRLLQMVSAGLPASALVSELGPLGLRLGSNSPGNLNPFKLEGPAGIFNPEATGAAEALGDAGGGSSAGGGSQGGGGSPVRERSSASAGEEEEDPLDSKERPEGMDDSLWIRLLEFRQTRADLEMEAEEAWRRVSLLTAQWDWMEAEDAGMEAAVEEAGARAAALRDGSTRLSLDISLTYRLKNGQVELPERPGDVVGAGDVLADALILHRNRVEALNEEVLSRGDNKIEVLEELRLTRRKIHLSQWETEAAELAGRHAAQRLTELQLLHVTKDLQAALRDPALVDRLHEEDRLLSVRQNIANLHVHKIEQRRRQLASLRARVSRSGTEQGELSVAEAAAEAAFQESTRMHLMMSHAKAAEDATHRRHMRAIVTNAQLRAIAQQQAADLERLGEQLRVSHARNFPALKPLSSWAPPDYRPPSAAAAALAAAAAAASPPPSPGSRAPSRGGEAAAVMPLPGAHRRVSNGMQQQQQRNSSGGGPGSRPASRAGTPLGVTRSGGAGATLTRAYVLASGGGALGTSASTVLNGGGGGGGAGLAGRPPSGAYRPASSASRRL